jgi:hypothetical protein
LSVDIVEQLGFRVIDSGSYRLGNWTLFGNVSLPSIEREADRAPHLRFWASVLQTVAGDWAHVDEAWYDSVETQLRA